jgi:hypothetical protein
MRGVAVLFIAGVCAAAPVGGMGRWQDVPIVGEIVRVVCCGRDWVGADRAHCCRRFSGCGAVFDDAELWDHHRPTGTCLAPSALGLTQTKNGIWRRARQ